MVTMPGMEWTLEIALVVLLAATLFQAVKLERALGVLKRDRASLESLVVHFNTSTHQAEMGIERLRAAAERQHGLLDADVARRGFARQAQRGDRLADRLDTLVRTARPLAQERFAGTADATPAFAADAAGIGSQIERNLLQALRLAR